MKKSEYVKQQKKLWNEACKTEGFNPEERFIVFRDDNPYSCKMLKLTLRYNDDRIWLYRERVSNLSSIGNYYNSIEQWYRNLNDVLFRFKIDPLPEITIAEGNAYIKIHDSTKHVYFTWYKMPETGHWEIICYLT